MAQRQQRTGYFFLCLILCNSAFSTYAAVERNAKAYGTAKFLNTVQNTLVKLTKSQSLGAKGDENLSPPRLAHTLMRRASYRVTQSYDTSSFLEVQSLTSLDQLIDNSIDKLRPAHLSGLMSMLETRKKEGMMDVDDTDSTESDAALGTLRITLKTCKVSRDMDNNVMGSGTNDMYIAAKVGGHDPRSMRKITMVHENTDSVDFEGKVDQIIEFRNVDVKRLKNFRLFALDDDAIGYDTIGKTRPHKLVATDGYVTKALHYGKHGDEKEAGKITYKVDWVPGAVPVKGVEGKAYRAPWKRFTNFPDYSRKGDLGSSVGTSAERNKARMLGFVIGLFAGASAGMLDMLDNLGEKLFEQIEENWGPVGKQWEKMQHNLAKAAKDPSFKTVKKALKELLLVGKVLLQFLWKVVTSKAGMMIGLVLAMIGLFWALVTYAPANFALMFTIVNAVFSAWYIADQFVAIYKNLHKCDGGECLVHHVYKGWGAVGRLIGYCVAEFLYMKSFQNLWKEGKALLQKMNKGGTSKINIDKLANAAKSNSKAATSTSSTGGKPQVDDLVANSHGQGQTYYAQRNAKAPKLESGEEIKKRLARDMAKYKGGTEPMVARPMGQGYYGAKAAKAPKVETADEIAARLAKTMPKYKKTVPQSEETAKRIAKKKHEVLTKGTDYWGALKKNKRL